MKWVEMTDDIYTSLPAARAAATKAVAKHDMLQLSYANHELQAARASGRKEPNGGFSSDHSSSSISLSNYKRSQETGAKQNLNAFHVLATTDEGDQGQEDSAPGVGPGEAHVAAVSMGGKSRVSSQADRV